jgi:hypothetical protein
VGFASFDVWFSWPLTVKGLRYFWDNNDFWVC